jgi:hypothetical protein
MGQWEGKKQLARVVIRTPDISIREDTALLKNWFDLAKLEVSFFFYFFTFVYAYMWVNACWHTYTQDVWTS